MAKRIGKESAAQSKVKKLMGQRGIQTHAQLARLLGFSSPALYGIINKQFKPTPEKISLMGHILGITSEEVCTMLDVKEEWRRTEAQQLYQERGSTQAQKTFYSVYELLCQGISLRYSQSASEKQQEILLQLSEVVRRYENIPNEYAALASDLTEILRGTFAISALERILPAIMVPSKNHLQITLDTLGRITSEKYLERVLHDADEQSKLNYEQSKSNIDKIYGQLTLTGKINFIEQMGWLIRHYERKLEQEPVREVK